MLIAPYVPFIVPPTGYEPYCRLPYSAVSHIGQLQKVGQFETADQQAKLHNGGEQWFFCIGAQCPPAADVFVRGRKQGRCRACWKEAAGLAHRPVKSVLRR